MATTRGSRCLISCYRRYLKTDRVCNSNKPFQVRVVVATITQRETQLPPLPASQEEEEAEFQAETTVSKQSSQTTTIIICQKIYQSQNYLMISQKTPSSTTVIFMVACSLCNIPNRNRGIGYFDFNNMKEFLGFFLFFIFYFRLVRFSSLLFGMRFDICTWVKLL